jgi:hypothetical protein
VWFKKLDYGQLNVTGSGGALQSENFELSFADAKGLLKSDKIASNFLTG